MRTNTNSPPLLVKFKALSEELCELIEQEGIVVRPFHQESLPYFRQLSSQEQSVAVENLKNYIQICHQVRNQGGKIREAATFVRTALDFYGYQYEPAVLAKIENDHLAEFYNLHNIQLFRTLSYFQYASYTIEDIHSRPWIHLYERDPGVTEQLMGVLSTILKGENRTYEIDVDEHLLVEKASLERLSVKVRVRYIVPLLKEGNTEAYLVVAACKPLLESTN